MRKKTDWATLGFQFLSFASMCLVLSMARLPFLLKVVLAFGVSLLLSLAWAYVRRWWRRRKAEPKRVRVVSIRNADD